MGRQTPATQAIRDAIEAVPNGLTGWTIGGVDRLAFTVAEVAQLIGLTERQVTGLIRSGELRARTTGRYYVIPGAALKEWLDAAEYANTG